MVLIIIGLIVAICVLIGVGVNMVDEAYARGRDDEARAAEKRFGLKPYSLGFWM